MTGTGLQEIKSGLLDGLVLQPGDAGSDGKVLRLILNTDVSKAKTKRVFKDGEHGSVSLTLRDGRAISTGYIVDSARPAVTVLNRTVTSIPGNTGLPLTLANMDAVPLRSKLTVALRSDSPAKFSRSEKVEIGTTDGTLHTELALADGSLVLQDSRTALAFLNPEKAFGASAFGPLQFRVVTTDAASDWQALGLMVRTPSVQQFSCAARIGLEAQEQTASGDLPCTLSGSNLFLIASTSADASFSKAAEVPAGLATDTLRVPRPADGHTLFLRLRDDPDHTATLSVDVVAKSR